MSVRDGLARENAETLKHFSKLLGGDKKITRKAELVNLIASHLQGRRLRELWDRLDPLQQAAIAEAIYSSSLTFDKTHFRAKYGEVPSLGENIHHYYSPSPPLARVLLHPDGISADLAARLKEFVPEPAPAAIISVAARSGQGPNERPASEASEDFAPAATFEMEQAAQRDLKLVLLLAREGKMRVGDKTGLPNAAGAKAFEGVLTGGDFYSPEHTAKEISGAASKVGPIKPFAWPLLLQAASLVVNGTRLKLTKAGDKALASAAPETISVIWKRWVEYTGFDEFRRIEAIKGQQGRARMSFVSVAVRRKVISAALRKCPEGEWIEVDEFFRFMQASKHYFEVTRNPWDLYISDSHYGSLGYDGYHEWEILQGRYILCLLFEYAATLGIVDVGYDSPVHARDEYRDLWGTDSLYFLSRYDGLIRFRLTPLGAYCLGSATEYSPKPPKPISSTASFTVMPSLRVMVNGELSVDELAMLELFAERVAETEWSIRTVRTLRAIEAGHDSDALAEFLQSGDEQPLPETVSKFFSDAVKRAVAVKDRGEARLIECADATLAETIATAEATKAYCFRAGDRHLVVSSKHEQSFSKGLEKLGYILTV
jgi:hypothetical protein